MARDTNISNLFRSVAAATALMLIAAAALTWMRGGGGSSDTAELAALSQALPAQADAAIHGREGAFAKLDASAKRLAALQADAGVAPGSSAQWQRLENGAATVLARRADVEVLTEAGGKVAADARAMLGLSDKLLDRAGSAAVMQEFQRRADRMGNSATDIAAQPDAAAVATAIGEDATFLRSVVDALGGARGGPDVRPLGSADREAVLVPIQSHLSELEAEVERLKGSAGEVSGLGAAYAEITDSADKLSTAFAGTAPAGPLPGFLQAPWIPLGLIGLALIFVLVLFSLNAKSSTFEAMAREQAAQNERNQQAILRLLDEMGSLADGDLTVQATVTEDITGTIADSFNYAIEELRKLVATVNETAIMVDSAAKQTESTASHMAKAADNQNREIKAATESIVSMAGSIEEVSGNAERSSDVARHSVEVAHKGGEAVRRTIDGMNAIRETIQDTSKRIKRLGESSQEIGNIIELINDIAEQTNILALNASIQASMAGEAGRGFAVVADEVQRLAERSTNATKQIEVLVRTIQADTKEAVVSMERSTTDVVGGALLAENAGAALDEIEQVSNQIASLVQNISSSARQQASSAADVSRRTTRLREISEQTGKATTATAAAVSKLSELASQLRKTVAGFTLPGGALKTRTLAASSPNVLKQTGKQIRTG
jgi:twitching motility protein PilJ